MREETAQRLEWVPPETPSGAAPTVVTAWRRDGPDRSSAALSTGSAGVAVARGDAREERSTVGADGTGALPGNPVEHLVVTGPGGILDGGFDLLRFRFWRLVALTAVLFLPIQLLDLWVALTTGIATSDSGSTDFSALVGPQGFGGSGWSIVLALLRAIALCLLGMAVGHLVAGWLQGRDPSFSQALGLAARRCWVAPIVVAVTLSAKVLLSCFGGVGFFLADALFFIAGIVAGAEVLGPFATIGRSFRLGRAAYGVALVTCIGGFVISQILQLALTLGPVVLVASFQPPEEWLVVVQQVASLVLLVALPLTACIAGRAYVELRCRTEGFDLTRRQEERGLR